MTPAHPFTPLFYSVEPLQQIGFLRSDCLGAEANHASLLKNATIILWNAVEALVWRETIARELSRVLGLPADIGWDLFNWPQGYCLVRYQKTNRVILIGRKTFTSPWVFIRHAVWLAVAPNLAEDACPCSVCSHRTQSVVAQETGIPLHARAHAWSAIGTTPRHPHFVAARPAPATRRLRKNQRPQSTAVACRLTQAATILGVATESQRRTANENEKLAGHATKRRRLSLIPEIAERSTDDEDLALQAALADAIHTYQAFRCKPGEEHCKSKEIKAEALTHNNFFPSATIKPDPREDQNELRPRATPSPEPQIRQDPEIQSEENPWLTRERLVKWVREGRQGVHPGEESQTYKRPKLEVEHESAGTVPLIKAEGDD